MRDVFYAFLSTAAIIAAWELGGYLARDNSVITYTQQRQDKELCERDIKRSERCVPVMMWLPEAAQ